MLQIFIPIRPTSCYRLQHCLVCSPSCQSRGFATLLCSQVQAPSRHNTRLDLSFVCTCLGLAWWNAHVSIVNYGVKRMTVVGYKGILFRDFGISTLFVDEPLQLRCHQKDKNWQSEISTSGPPSNVVTVSNCVAH